MATQTHQSSAATADQSGSSPATTRTGVLLRSESLAAMIGAFLYLLMLAVILMQNGATLTYSLDDPYIHLALAENLLAGHYGINLGEPSAPSSSILYPVLLAGLLVLQTGAWAPAVLNFAATLGSFWLIQSVLLRAGLGLPALARWFSVMLGVVVGLAFNLVGVAFTGMEHSVHVLVTLLALYGLIEVSEGRRVPAWLWLVLIVGPLIRFEGLAVSVPALLALFLLGRRRSAVIAGGLIVLTLGGYSLFLIRLGLPPLPTSVLMRSDVASSAVDPHSPLALARVFLGNALEALRRRPGALLFLFGAATVLAALESGVRSDLRRLAVPGVAAVAVLLHFLAGRFGWFERYEIYILLFAFLTMTYAWRSQIAAYARRSRLGVGVAALALVVVNLPYVQATVLTPAAARNIYEQQYQMHRFAVEVHQGPVAVNDIGWVSFRNPYYVLDLWGLASKEARRARTQSRKPYWMDELASEHGVAVAMVYEDWFPHGLPESWTRVARLRMGSERITAARSLVSFYVTPQADGPAVMAELERFAAMLPSGVRLNLFDVPSLRTASRQTSADMH